jgi:hypothetical protein
MYILQARSSEGLVSEAGAWFDIAHHPNEAYVRRFAKYHKVSNPFVEYRIIKQETVETVIQL